MDKINPFDWHLLYCTLVVKKPDQSIESYDGMLYAENETDLFFFSDYEEWDGCGHSKKRDYGFTNSWIMDAEVSEIPQLWTDVKENPEVFSIIINE